MSETKTTDESAPAQTGVPRRGSRRRWWVGIVGVLALLLVVTALCSLFTWRKIQASLPQLDGEVSVRGLSAPATIERDARGVPVLCGASRTDVAVATGFAHAQDRFFQMDLLRRRSAAEASALLGPGGLYYDELFAPHRFRRRAARVVESLSADERRLLEAYAAGVNAGLASLGEVPPEYLALGVEPEGWTPEDSVLAVLSMFTYLQDYGGIYESGLAVMSESLPPEAFDFLVPSSTDWDVPLVGEPPEPSEIPGPEVLDLSREQSARAVRPEAGDPSGPYSAQPLGGSNAWAVADERTSIDGALLANDLHTTLSVPNLWYRASLVWPDDAGGEHRVIGVTLPGAPLVVVGSNGSIAWGLTNSLADAIDLVVIEPAHSGDAYLTPDGPRPFERSTVSLAVRGEEPRNLEVVETLWGPVVGEDHRGRLRAMRWVAHEPDAVNFHSAGLETATTVEEALDLAPRAGLPAQSLMVVDDSGDVGWTIIGYLPRREGFAGRLPGSWSDGTRRWAGRLPADQYPRVVEPENGFLWAANNRMVAGDIGATVGDGGYHLATRARQIHQSLATADPLDERGMLALQLDDRDLFLLRWRDLLLEVLTPEGIGGDPTLEIARNLVAEWQGRATPDSVGYRIVRAFRVVTMRNALGPLTDMCNEDQAACESYREVVLEEEQPLWDLVQERPAHLLDPRFESWDELLTSSLESAVESLAAAGPLAERTWGELNTTAIRHPFSQAVPALGRWLDMPAEQLPGGEETPRVQLPDAGASLRMVVSPGHEEDGIFHMPTGQSGHFLSPHYRDGHAAWSRGEATPLLPGPVEHRLRLVPAG